jgi:hypothetical protein
MGKWRLEVETTFAPIPIVNMLAIGFFLFLTNNSL